MASAPAWRDNLSPRRGGLARRRRDRSCRSPAEFRRRSAPARRRRRGRSARACARQSSAVPAIAKASIKRSSSTASAGSPRRRRSRATANFGLAMPLCRTIVSRNWGQCRRSAIRSPAWSPIAALATCRASSRSGRTAQGTYCTTSSARPPRRVRRYPGRWRRRVRYSPSGHKFETINPSASRPHRRETAVAHRGQIDRQRRAAAAGSRAPRRSTEKTPPR